MTPFELRGDLRLRTYARALEAATEEYRVLRRLPVVEEFWMQSMPHGPDVTVGILDIETTGLEDDAAIIELALVKIALVDGQLGDMTHPVVMREDPGKPLTPEIERLTGLVDADLAGHTFDEWALAGHLRDVDVLCAFNASFDAPRLRRRFGWMIQPWICAMKDFDWATAGWEGRTQQALLAHARMFYVAHRAAVDTAALAVLLALPAPDGRTIAANILDNGRQQTVRVAARGAPFGLRAELRERGYRWDGVDRQWSIEVKLEAVEDEVRALRRLSSLIRPTRRLIDWHERHTR